MVLSDDKKRYYMRRLLLSRLRLLVTDGFYGLLLMHMIYALDENCKTVSTDGQRIFFNPKYLDGAGDCELDYAMMHEILHVALQHCMRGGERDESSDAVCDAEVDAEILNSAGGRKFSAQNEGGGTEPFEDDHSRWNTAQDGEALRDVWDKRLADACEAMSLRDPSNQRGLLPAFAARRFSRLRRPQTDWRAILDDFVQEEVVDYSFTPPDRRFDGSPFFLPDFNEKDETVGDILFMIDTSASMTDEKMTAAYCEVKGAVEQYNGKLRGRLGFFDAAVTEPRPFTDEAQFCAITPKGGGGTDFGSIFEYVRDKMSDNPPASIIILTDGGAPFPRQSAAMGIPVLWLLNNTEAAPPWGKTARITP